MRSYGQYCAMAKALDVVGDRWSLLIVRELMLRDACRYTDLREGLPGIATNLLADRLRELEAADVVRREAAPPPIATTVFRLTPRGRDLRPVVHAIARWGGALMGPRPDGDTFRAHWLALPFDLYLTDHRPADPPATVQIQAGEGPELEPLVVETDPSTEHGIRTRQGTAENPDAVVTGPPDLVLGLFAGLVPLSDARARGLEYTGDRTILTRLHPDP